MLVFGTRPEAIKMGSLFHELNKHKDKFEVMVCVTGQHRDMLDQALDLFNIKPDIDFNIMTKNQDLFSITSTVLNKMREVIEVHTPDLILVHGDTTTSFAASIAAYYSNIKVGHIEAGLRTNNLYNPFPEEFNRQCISVVSKWHFAPTLVCYENLLSENIQKKNIFVTGNTVIDSLHYITQNIENDENRRLIVTKKIDKILTFDWKIKRFILITAHRRENFGKGIISICLAILKLAKNNNNIYFVFPVHPNPKIKEKVIEILSNTKNIILVSPLDYELFTYILKKSYLVLTDSGGIQEEAPSFGVPVLVMRDQTERIEAIESGGVKLIGTEFESIVNNVELLLNNHNEYSRMSRLSNPYGTGNACKKIVEILLKEFKL